MTSTRRLRLIADRPPETLFVSPSDLHTSPPQPTHNHPLQLFLLPFTYTSAFLVPTPEKKPILPPPVLRQPEMLFRSFGLCATFALAANSVLLPPNLESSSLEALDFFIDAAAETRNVIIKLPCTECHEAAHDKSVWPADEETSLVRVPSLACRNLD